MEVCCSGRQRQYFLTKTSKGGKQASSDVLSLILMRKSAGSSTNYFLGAHHPVLGKIKPSWSWKLLYRIHILLCISVRLKNCQHYHTNVSSSSIDELTPLWIVFFFFNPLSVPSCFCYHWKMFGSGTLRPSENRMGEKTFRLEISVAQYSQGWCKSSTLS